MKLLKLGDWEFHIETGKSGWADEEISNNWWITFKIEHITQYEKLHRERLKNGYFDVQ